MGLRSPVVSQYSPLEQATQSWFRNQREEAGEVGVTYYSTYIQGVKTSGGKGGGFLPATELYTAVSAEG